MHRSAQKFFELLVLIAREPNAHRIAHARPHLAHNVQIFRASREDQEATTSGLDNSFRVLVNEREESTSKLLVKVREVQQTRVVIVPRVFLIHVRVPVDSKFCQGPT